MDEQDHLTARQLEKDDAMAAIWQAIHAIDDERRNPDLWERLLFASMSQWNQLAGKSAGICPPADERR